MENRTVFQHAHRERERIPSTLRERSKGRIPLEESVPICISCWLENALGTHQTVPQKQFNPQIAFWEAGTQPPVIGPLVKIKEKSWLSSQVTGYWKVQSVIGLLIWFDLLNQKCSDYKLKNLFLVALHNQSISKRHFPVNKCLSGFFFF